MARGMATMAVNGPSVGAGHESIGEPTAPLMAQRPTGGAPPGTATAAPSPARTVRPSPIARPRPRPRPSPRPGATSEPMDQAAKVPVARSAWLPDEGTQAAAGPEPSAAADPPDTAATPEDAEATSWGAPASSSTTVAPPQPAEVEDFLRLFYAEADQPGATTVKGVAARTVPFEERLEQVREEIEQTGTYVHTSAELAFGARVAWRNSARCIGRLYWRSLHLRDRRHVVAPDEVASECIGHLDDATRRGRIRSTITVFAPDTPTSSGPRVWNEQLIRYAGYRTGGRVLGDPRYVGFTDHARSLGWVPPTPMGRFDVLPLMISGGGQWAEKGPQLYDVPPESALEVELTHPDHAWFAQLGLRWHALPVISNMRLDIGGVSYPAAPFNGWYMATEIGARNLSDSDRYDMLAEVAEAMGLDTSSDRTMWRDRAAVELTLAVQHSFDQAGVSMADHHGESERFLRHLEREEVAGRTCPVDWSWIVPPISGGLTPVFHRYYDEPTDTGPMFRMDPQQAARGQGCPV